MVTAEMIAERASKVMRQPITADMVKTIQLVAVRLRAKERDRRNAEGPEWIRCVCGCGQVFPRRYAREKIHPACRQRAYRNPTLLAICKGRTPVVVPAPPPGV